MDKLIDIWMRDTGPGEVQDTVKWTATGYRREIKKRRTRSSNIPGGKDAATIEMSMSYDLEPECCESTCASLFCRIMCFGLVFIIAVLVCLSVHR